MADPRGITLERVPLSSGFPSCIVTKDRYARIDMDSILVIEPDGAVGRLFETALRTAGYHVYVATNAEEGYEVLRRTAVRMVITDLNMPSSSGLEVIAVVRDQFPDTKIVGIAGEASEYDPVRAAPLLDTVEVLANPIGVNRLMETVQRVLGNA